MIPNKYSFYYPNNQQKINYPNQNEDLRLILPPLPPPIIYNPFFIPPFPYFQPFPYYNRFPFR